MSEVAINELLQQMRVMAAQAERGGSAAEGPADANRPDFGALLKSSIDQVNATQQQAAGLSEAFQQGDPSADLAQVMVALQKASVSFQAMTQVRNKLLTAYQDIMNMPL